MVLRGGFVMHEVEGVMRMAMVEYWLWADERD